MTKKEFLLTLRELLRTAIMSTHDPDDHSGCNTRYYVDQEQLMKNIEAELETIESQVICERCGIPCEREEVDVGVGIQYGPWFCPICG